MGVVLSGGERGVQTQNKEGGTPGRNAALSAAV